MFAGMMGTPRKHKFSPTPGYLARPKLGALKNVHSGSRTNLAFEKKKKSKKPSTTSSTTAMMNHKMEYHRLSGKRPDYADTAYREAVSRLRILLAESYVVPIVKPQRSSASVLRDLGGDAGDETDNQSLVSGVSRLSRYPPQHYTHFGGGGSSKKFSPRYATLSDHHKQEIEAPPEFAAFVERQEEYIEQLEKESRFCRDELATLLSKVKDVISENECLHEKQKKYIMKSVYDQIETETETENDDFVRSKQLKSHHRILEGPAIVFESRISELEAQLTQTKIELKKAHDENEQLKQKGSSEPFLDGDLFRKQIDNLQRDKNLLQETVTKLQSALNVLRDKEYTSSDQVKRSLDVAEQAQYERNSAEQEIRRLKDELERQHSKLRETMSEQNRRVADERAQVERRYTQQIEQLTTELGVHWEQNSKIQLELDKQRRENADMRRELAQKQAQIDDLKKEMQNKIINLQSDIGVTGAEKSALEGQIASLQMVNERGERQAKQDTARLQVEMQSLRQRLDRADADLIHSKRENVRLVEQNASLEKELKMNAALAEERTARTETIPLPPPSKEKDMSLMIKDMEAKHVATVAELEGMIQTQNQLMDKLSAECHTLTHKLEESSTRHKEEIRELQTNLGYLTNRFKQSQIHTSNDKDDGSYSNNTAPNDIAPISNNAQIDDKVVEEQLLNETTPYYDETKQQQQQQQPHEEQQEAQEQQQEFDVTNESYQEYDPNAYPEQEYDPNQQYMTQEQYDQQYGEYVADENNYIPPTETINDEQVSNVNN